MERVRWKVKQVRPSRRTPHKHQQRNTILLTKKATERNTTKVSKDPKYTLLDSDGQRQNPLSCKGLQWSSSSLGCFDGFHRTQWVFPTALSALGTNLQHTWTRQEFASWLGVLDFSYKRMLLYVCLILFPRSLLVAKRIYPACFVSDMMFPSLRNRLWCWLQAYFIFFPRRRCLFRKPLQCLAKDSELKVQVGPLQWCYRFHSKQFGHGSKRKFMGTRVLFICLLPIGFVGNQVFLTQNHLWTWSKP